MAPKGDHDQNAGEGGSEQAALPSEVIAQAQAAISGTLEDERDAAPSGRRSSRAEQSFTQKKSSKADQQSASTPQQPKRQNLQVPNDGSNDAPPAYGEHPDQIEMSQDGFDTKAKVTDDGRINIHINQKTRKLSDLLVPALRNQLSLVAKEDETPLPPGYIPPALGGQPGQLLPPKLNVVIHVVGSRGDVQPFVALGKTLKATYGHRVRLATHPTFKEFIEENGLEFFSIGGDPSELMAFMVKNPGLMPGFDSLKSGDVGKRRKGMEEIVLGCWRSCIEAGDGLGAAPPRGSTDSLGFDAGINMDTNPSERPFIADAIIANPPSFAHIHIAEKMGIPLHMMFTMPWSPTQQFPHPLANIQSSNADVNMTNFVSYALVEMMTWQGLGDVINRFRERALGLDPISLIWAPGMLSRLRVPYTYCWSPALIPKPKDWGQHISISGFYFLSLASSYTPEAALAEYLAAGPPPVYIGFGSIVVDDPNAMTKLIFEAVQKAGVRALVSKGWGGLGADELGIPEGVFMLGNVPHDWLFQHVSAVVHHGGAGTTAAGIATGKPTVVVPFFGDQPFWGAMVARAGAGPLPIPYKQLTADKLAAALIEALKPETLAKAKELGASIKEEKGTEVGAKAFHDRLEVDELRCSLAPSRVAVWRVKRTETRLSAFAANVLSSEGLLDFGDLKLYRPKDYETEDGPWDPISGGASALLGTIASLTMGVADFPLEIFKAVRTKQSKDKSAREQAARADSSSGDNTPASHSRSTSQLDLTADGTSELKLKSTDSASLRTYTSAPSGKTSYEGTERSSTADTDITSPMTSTASLGHGQGLPRHSSMKDVLKGALNRSRSNSRDRGSTSRSDSRRRQSDNASPIASPSRKEFDPSKLTLENAIGAGKGVSRIVGAGVKSPMDFTLGIARGFHNAPKLYGDDTVRPQGKVTDFQSGLKAAGKEFGFGFYDGITGLVTQPMRGAEKEGTVGLLKGIGKGIGGLVLKPGAAIWGLPGYAFMGVHKEIRKMFGSSVLNYIISARTAQGFEDNKAATPQERQDVLLRWRQHKDEYQSARQKIAEHGPDGQDRGRLSPKGFLQTRHMTFDERKKLHDERQARRALEHDKGQSVHTHRDCHLCHRHKSHKQTPHAAQQTTGAGSGLSEDQQLEFEHAIHASVEATSRGNPEEDMMIERAIRASVRELQSANGSQLDDPDAMDRAIQASIAEASRRQDTETSAPGPITMSDEEAEHQAALEKAIQESLMHYKLSGSNDEHPDNDEDLKLAIHRSEQDASHRKEAEDGKINDALQQIQAKEKAKTEEEVVLEYVKKQSLAEDQHRQVASQKGKGKEEESEADAAAMKSAMEESLKGAGGSGSGT